MEMHGRHIMINCEGVGGEPPASVRGLCLFLAARLLPSSPIRHIEQVASRIEAMINSYEKGVR